MPPPLLRGGPPSQPPKGLRLPSPSRGCGLGLAPEFMASLQPRSPGEPRCDLATFLHRRSVTPAGDTLALLPVRCGLPQPSHEDAPRPTIFRRVGCLPRCYVGVRGLTLFVRYFVTSCPSLVLVVSPVGPVPTVRPIFAFMARNSHRLLWVLASTRTTVVGPSTLRNSVGQIPQTFFEERLVGAARLACDLGGAPSGLYPVGTGGPPPGCCRASVGPSSP